MPGLIHRRSGLESGQVIAFDQPFTASLASRSRSGAKLIGSRRSFAATLHIGNSNLENCRARMILQRKFTELVAFQATSCYASGVNAGDV